MYLIIGLLLRYLVFGFFAGHLFPMRLVTPCHDLFLSTCIGAHFWSRLLKLILVGSANSSGTTIRNLWYGAKSGLVTKSATAGIPPNFLYIHKSFFCGIILCSMSSFSITQLGEFPNVIFLALCNDMCPLSFSIVNQVERTTSVSL